MRQHSRMAGPWKFTLSCPNGHYVTEEGYEEGVLRAHLKRGAPIRLYCRSCDQHWEATAEQRGMIDWALSRR
jgi:hypothetical protein